MRRPVLAIACAVALAGCIESPSAPVVQKEAPSAALVPPNPWESSASLYWNALARQLVATNLSSPFFAIRGYALLSVAQYNAAVTAEKDNERGSHASVRAAVAAASVVALSYLYPAATTNLENLYAQFLNLPAWPGESHTDAAQGEAIGRSIAQQLVTRAQGDNFFAPWSGTVPVGPGRWFSSTTPPTPPVGVLFGQARTYFLLSGDQFRPPPPPAFGSPEFLAALAEVRQISDTRTPEQDASAKFWAFPAGTYQPAGYWNEQAALLAVQYHLDERRIAHAFALMNMVGFDAIVAMHDCKYAYWFIRPSQADPGITLSVGLPNFPSYGSNHAALSGGMARILATLFPADAERLDGLADQAALSRLYGGIHYRFDNDTGLRLGRTIAAFALSLDVNGHEPFVLR